MISFGADTGETVLLSSAEMSAVERSCAVAGVVTCEEMLLSRHHFTVEWGEGNCLRRVNENVRFNLGIDC